MLPLLMELYPIDINTILEIGATNTTLTTNGGNVDISGVIRAVAGETSNNFTINAGTGNVTFSSNLTRTEGDYVAGATQGEFTSVADLDFSGDFINAINLGGSAVSIGNANFLSGLASNDSNTSTVVEDFQHQAITWGSFLDYGDSRLSELMEGMRWAVGSSKSPSVTFTNAEIGKKYKIQALFKERCCITRTFDVYLGDTSTVTKVIDNYTTNTTNSTTELHSAVGRYLTYQFQAASTDVKFLLSGSTTAAPGTLDTGPSGNWDTNPIINAISIEEVSAGATINNLTVTANQFNAQAIELGGTLAITNSGSSTISGVISGDTALTKAGSGSLALPSTNTYTGRTTINEGTINITKDAGLGAAPGSFVADQLIFNGGEIFNYNGASFSLNANRGITLTGDGTIRVNNSGLITVPGAITGSGSLTLRANNLLFNSRLKLTGTNTYTGDTIIQGGTIIIDGAGTLGNGSYAGDITIGSLYSGKFDYASSTDLIASGVISGQGILQASGTGVFEPTATNTYTGGTIIDGGKIAARTDRNFGANPSSDDPDNVLLRNTGTIYFGSVNSSNSLGHVNFGYNNNRGIYLEIRTT